METINVSKATRKKVFNLRKLRKSLKFRPEIFRLILKMRLCIKKKTSIIKKIMHDNKMGDSLKKMTLEHIEKSNTEKPIRIDISTQTEIFNENNSTTTINQNSESINDVLSTESHKGKDGKPTSPGWMIDNNGEKSIADQVKEVAESAIEQSGMVYVESAGMYYDYKTGYYYSSDLGLYYHTDTGCYYYYSNEAKTFVFHSYPDKSAQNIPTRPKIPTKIKKSKKKKQSDDVDNLIENLSQDEDEKPEKKRRKVTKVKSKDESSVGTGTDSRTDTNVENNVSHGEQNSPEVRPEEKKVEELEDGECSDSGSELSDAESSNSTSTATDDESVARHHPPCMRIIIRETNLPKLKVGSLYLVTKDGGTLGREGEQHALVIRDTNVSRNHLNIKYDMDRSAYFVTDLGSRNGTILNGSRMSQSQEVSKPMEVLHGSVIQVGETKLLCHIHPGTDTCGHCEPGLIMESQEKEKKVAYTRTCSVQKQHQLELARLKNKYAPEPLAIEEKAYNDRAQARREQHGSSHHAEKTQSSDVDTFIAPENKGFKLLEKMGWSKGEGLGKDSQGDTEPIPMISNEGKTGLGATPGPAGSVKVSKTLGPATMRLATKTKMLRPPAKAFQQPPDDESE